MGNFLKKTFDSASEGLSKGTSFLDGATGGYFSKLTGGFGDAVLGTALGGGLGGMLGFFGKGLFPEAQDPTVPTVGNMPEPVISKASTEALRPRFRFGADDPDDLMPGNLQLRTDRRTAGLPRGV